MVATGWVSIAYTADMRMDARRGLFSGTQNIDYAIAVVIADD